MKQIDNRQKKRIQMRVASSPKKGGFFGAHSKEKTRIPHPTSKDSEIPQTASEKPQPVSSPPKVGRNDPCPCGSGLKYKKCCLLKPVQQKDKGKKDKGQSPEKGTD